MSEEKNTMAPTPRRIVKKNTELAPRYELVEQLKAARKAQDMARVPCMRTHIRTAICSKDHRDRPAWARYRG